MKKMKTFKMPSAFVVIFVALAITVALTWVIPSSVADPDTMKITYGAYLNDDGEVVKSMAPQAKGLWDFFAAPMEGFVDGGNVILAILLSGGFVGVLNYIGALDAGIGILLKKLKGKILIIAILFFISLLGTVYGFWEEIAAFSIIIVPMFLRAKYDVMTGIAVMFVGATIGVMSSIINPFSVGTAVASIGDPELSIGSGIILRIILFVTLFIIGAVRMVTYAERVKADPTKSITYDIEATRTIDTSKHEALPEMDRKKAISLGVFGIMILLIIMGYVPWADFGLYDAVNKPFDLLAKVPFIGKFFGIENMTYFGDWYFLEFNVLFLVGALIIGFINRIKEAEFIRVFIDGCRDLLGVALVLAVARGISVIMGDKYSGMSVTIVYKLRTMLEGVPLWSFAVVAIFMYMIIGLFLQSSSGVAGLTMPILGVVAAALFMTSTGGAQFGEIILISAYTLGLNFTAGIYPDATAMGVIELFHVPYDRYFRFMVKTYSIFLLAGAIILSLATLIPGVASILT